MHSLLNARRVVLPSLSNCQETHTQSVQNIVKPQNMIARINEKQLKKEFDLIVIGGGINGCGIARDAVSRGLKVLLLEKEDFGSGCSSISTRLIHGGLRYLEHLEFGLVRESLHEEKTLLKNANHLVRSLEFCFPVYRNDKRSPFVIKMGMIIYDLLSIGRDLPGHRILSPDEFQSYDSALNDDGLVKAVVFYDSQVLFPERICLENILMAKQKGAVTLNHAEVKKINIDANKITSLEFLDLLSNRKWTVSGKVVINASGPWLDKVNGIAIENPKTLLGGTKGSHIIINKFQNGPKQAIIHYASDGRPVFIIPWKDYYLIGTTDIPFDGDLDHVSITRSEIDYLINETNKILKNKIIKISDVLYTYSGVRPLPYSPGSNPSAITRRHIIFDHSQTGLENMISIIGGKLTTYRNLSEQAVNLTFKKLDLEFVACSTRAEPLIGCLPTGVQEFKEKYVKKAEKKYDIDPDIISFLIDFYGTRFKDVLDLTLQEKELGKLLSSSSLDIMSQIFLALQDEMAWTVTDILLRRTSLGLSSGLGESVVSDIAKILQVNLNLSKQEIEKQINDYYEKVVKLRVGTGFVQGFD